ncbi:MAG: 50S ribosomal protein L29 [Acidobacteria bacterium]|nr:50S ribosomal protein L29 [Acidobacteriota bacterium]
MKIEKVRELQGEELTRKVEEIHDQLFKLRIQQAIGQPAAPIKVRGLRKDIARLRTVETERARKQG